MSMLFLLMRTLLRDWTRSGLGEQCGEGEQAWTNRSAVEGLDDERRSKGFADLRVERNMMGEEGVGGVTEGWAKEYLKVDRATFT